MRKAKEASFQNGLMLLTAGMITLTGILFHQSVFNILPLYISLLVSRMLSRVNRLAFLIGAINSVWYCLVYCGMGLYASAAYALLFSFTMQMGTYFMWHKRPSGQATVFRKLKGIQRVLGVLLLVAVWLGLYLVMPDTGAKYRGLDILSSLLGVATSLLTMLAFQEYTVLSIAGQVNALMLYTCMMRDNPAQITYLIYTLYSAYCQIVAFGRVRYLYKQQTSQANV